jgi:hypothetical protein
VVNISFVAVSQQQSHQSYTHLDQPQNSKTRLNSGQWTVIYFLISRRKITNTSKLKTGLKCELRISVVEGISGAPRLYPAIKRNCPALLKGLSDVNSNSEV